MHSCQFVKMVQNLVKAIEIQQLLSKQHVLPDRYHNGNCQIPKIARQLAPAQTVFNNAKHAQILHSSPDNIGVDAPSYSNLCH